MKKLLRHLFGFLVVSVLLLAGVIAFGTSAPLPELKTLSWPKGAEGSAPLPPLLRLAVPRGSPLAYRRYGEAQKSVVIALHGSSALSASLHPFAQVFAQRGHAVYVPDIRGHGESAPRGDVDYFYQPDDDLMALITLARRENPGKPVHLAGFSLGSGLALGFAARHPAVDLRRVMLLAPALGPQAPTSRKVQGWSAPHIPRIIGLTILNGIGIHAFDHLEAITFAVPPGSGALQVASYSHRLLGSLLTRDWKGAITRSRAKMDIVMGESDELFDASRVGEVVAVAPDRLRAVVLPGMNHLRMSFDPEALNRIAALMEEERP